MTALLQERMRSFERWTYHLFTLASGTKAWKNGMCALDLATGKVKPAAATGSLLVIGVFQESVDATGGDAQVNVNLCREIEVEWWANAGGITAAMVGALAYVADDQTVSNTGTVVAGRIWAVHSVAGVAVQKLPVSLAELSLPLGEEPADEDVPVDEEES